MAISIQTNVNSLVAQQNLSVTNKFQSQTITQLTSGYRINSSGDDAAGLAVANKFRSTVAELTQGVANGNDATAQLQIMDGGMSNISQILDRLKTLATQSASGTFTGNRTTLNNEFQTDIAEIDRQAQSIGLDTGGTFAKSLSVYLGQGSGSGNGMGGTAALDNGSVVVDLSASTVDSGSLGLKGLKAIAGSVGATGTDIGTGSTNGTTVADILDNKAGNTMAKAGSATFNFSGPGFSDSSKVSVSANLNGVSDIASLVTALNQAISNAAGGGSQADQALKGANIVATVNTDQFGHQQLAFSSSNTAFQVQAGDQMANALMGNFATPGSATGKAVTSTVTGGTAGVSTAAFDPANVSVQISGGGLSGTVNLSLSASDKVVGDATADVIKQVTQNKQLQDAGISVTLTAANKLQFSSSNGAGFNVSSVGDNANALGLGTFVTTSALNGAATYSDISAAAAYSAADTGNGVATLGFSLDGGVTGGITPASVTGSVTGTGYNGGGTPNGTVGNAAGALGSMSVTVNGTAVTVDFAKDANRSGTETVQKAADFINSQIQAKAGYGSDVKLATVDAATQTIKLMGPADGAGTIDASGAAATALGLTAAAGANMVAASGTAGNTVAVNLAGGDATGAVATGSAPAAAHMATGTTATMALKIDGTTVNADFSKDVNAAGTAAVFTSGILGTDASSTVDVSAIQGTAGTVSSSILGANGATSTMNVGTFTATMVSATGAGGIGGATTDAMAESISNFAAANATFTGTSLGTVVGGDVNLTSLDLTQFKTTAATATGGAFGTDMNAAVDLSQFAAKAATTSSTVSLPSSGLDYQSWAATKAVMAGTAVSADDLTPIAAINALNPLMADQNLIVNGHSINISGANSLTAVATLITNTAAVGVTAAALNGVLTLTSTAAGTGANTTIDVVNNTASVAAGLTVAGPLADRTAAGTDAITLNLQVDALNAGAVKKIDISQAHNLTDVVSAINGASGFNSTVATANTDGTITLSGAVLGAAGKVNVSNTAASNALGFTTGTAANNNAGVDATKLKVNIDGLGELDVDVSGAITVGQVAAKINLDLKNATIYGNTYQSAVSGASGALAFTGATKGNTGEINIGDNAVAQALKLTSGTGDLDHFGHTGTNLELEVEGTKYSIDISGVTDVTTGATAGLVNVINTATTHTTAAMGTTTGANLAGALILTGNTAGAANHVKVTDNAVSRLLGLTTPNNSVDVKGKDALTLDVQIDGGKLEHIDLADVAFTHSVGGSVKATEIVAGINTILQGKVADGYSATGTYAALKPGNSGNIVINSAVNGGSLLIKDNAVSEWLGLTSSATKTDVVKSRADTTLNLQIDGKKQVNIALDSLGGAARLVDIADAINTSLKNNIDYGAEYANVAKANTDGTISLSGVTGGGTLKVVNSTLSDYLKLTQTGADAFNTGAAPSTLDISIDGGATKSISFAGITGGKTPTLTDIANQINTALSADAGYGSAFGGVAQANSDGTISISGLNRGMATGSLTIANNAAGQMLGLTLGGGASVTHTGQNESAADVVSFLNSTAQQALGTTSDANIVSLDSAGKVVVASQSKGAASNVSVLSTGTTAGLAASLKLDAYVDNAAKGWARSLQSVVDSLKQSFNGNATLQQAGLTADINQATQSLEISSANGTQFRIDAWGTENSTNKSDLGFGVSGQAFTQANSTLSTSSVVDTQGASAIGTSANGSKNVASISFQAMQFGNDDQSITISANSAAGVAQTPLTITLQNDSTAQTGATIDSAISTINTKLQQSNNATLRSITAVSETAADGTESINLISSLSSFNVSVSSSAGAAVGDGLNGGKAQTFSSATNGSASSISIDTQAGAQQALLALSSAVGKLGAAQATIGRGENQLGYAINLAQSQITNFSSAESQIRDANVAQQAANLSKAQTLSQASIAAMAQANSATQGVLALLRG